MKPRLLILGAGGHGRVCAEIAELLGQWESIAFLDDADTLPNTFGNPLLGRLETVFQRLADYQVVVAIGHNPTRLAWVERLMAAAADLPVLIHPAAWVSHHASLGAGTVVLAGAIVNTSAEIGRGCLINLNACIDHDCRLADGVHVGAGTIVRSSVVVGPGALLATGVIVRPGKIIADGEFIPEGSLV